MTLQQSHFIKKDAKQEDNLLVDTDKIGLGLPSHFLQPTFSWKDIMQAFLVCRNGWVKHIELREEEGLRVYFTDNPDLKTEETIQLLRKMMERIMRTPITLYWTATYIDFIPL